MQLGHFYWPQQSVCPDDGRVLFQGRPNLETEFIIGRSKRSTKDESFLKSNKTAVWTPLYLYIFREIYIREPLCLLKILKFTARIYIYSNPLNCKRESGTRLIKYGTRTNVVCVCLCVCEFFWRRGALYERVIVAQVNNAIKTERNVILSNEPPIKRFPR